MGLGNAADSVLGLEEDLEARGPPLCSACRGCAECRFRREICTEEDRAILARVEKVMIMSSSRLEASYPRKACAGRMKDNRKQAVRDQERIKTRQIKSGIQEMYKAEVVKGIDAGSLVKLSPKEIKGWRAPIHYINTFGFIKDSSLSTKCRAACDAARRNAHTGLSLSDYMEKGPDETNQLQEVLLHFRNAESADILDMEKVYQSTHTRETEKQLRQTDKVGGAATKEGLRTRRRFLWESSANSCSRSSTAKPTEGGQEETVSAPKPREIAADMEAPPSLHWARTSIKQASSWNTAQGTLTRILRSHCTGIRGSTREEPTPRER